MEGLLDGRRALVTGAGSGIGAGIALAMSRAGAFVICADIDGEAAIRTAARIGADAAAYALDVTDRAGVDALAASIQGKHGPIDILVNNAGIIRRGLVEDGNTRAEESIRAALIPQRVGPDRDWHFGVARLAHQRLVLHLARKLVHKRRMHRRNKSHLKPGIGYSPNPRLEPKV